jgi:multidrug resistance efflux pump
VEIEAKVDNLEAPLTAACAKNNELESRVEGLTAKLAAARKETEKL